MKKNAVNFMMIIFAIIVNIVAINAQTKSPSVEVVDENQNKQNLILKKLDIDIKVVGNLAVTTMDMTFTNDFPAKSRALEGTLIFPLAEGQSVNRLAMDFNGIMREGVIVEKEKGRVVFEEIERRGVDPALLEMTTSNNYKLRIFPIMPGKERRIIIAYEEILKSNSDGMAYNLPLEFEKEIKDFTLKANVYNEVQPITNGKAAFEKDDNSYNLEYEYSDYKAKEMFSFSIPTPENQKSILCEMIDGERFFVVNRSIEIPKADKLIANKITILWDCSHSSNKRDIKKEIELLREYFKANPQCTVEFITFNYKIKTKEEFKITNSNADELIRIIEKVRYDGGSNFDGIDLSKNKSDMIMMFTDGISSLGNSKTITSEAPINTINSNLTANNFYLNDIANNSGGSSINLLNCEVEQAVKVLTEKQYRLISIENNAAETEEIFPKSTQNLIQDLSIAGKMKSDIAKIKLNYGYGNKVKRSEIIFIDANENKVESGVISRIWSKKKLDNLAENPKKNKAEMLAIGQKYNIVSQNTSLIVLETAWDYVRYKIEPPKSDTALYNEYHRMVESYKKYAAEQSKNQYYDPYKQINMLLANFKDRKNWYFTNHQELYVIDSINNQMNKHRDSINNQIKEKRYKEKLELYKAKLELQKAKIDSLNNIIDTYNKTHGQCTGEGSVKGRVLIQDAMPASGSTIRIIGTNRGAKAKTNGTFTLTGVPCGIQIFRINYLGEELLFSFIVKENGVQDLEDILIPCSANYEDVCVIAEKIDITRTASGSLISSSTLELNAREGISSIVGATAGVQSAGDGYSIRGSRADETTINSNINLSIYSSSETYFAELKALDGEAFRDKYFEHKTKFGNVIGYYIDVAELLTERKDMNGAEEVISNIAELGDENQEFMRLVAYKLQNLKKYDLAKQIFEYIAEIRAEEPQSFRDLAIINEEMGNYQAAADLYYKVALGKWDWRFSGIDQTALTELNTLIAKHYKEIITERYDSQLIYAMPLDLRIVFKWDVDNIDLDLSIKDPNGEMCKWTHTKTKIGGLMPYYDIDGYGPEEFLLKSVMKGKYELFCNYYSSFATKLTGGVTLFIDIYTNYGKPNETKRTSVMRLKDLKETIKIGEIEIE